MKTLFIAGRQALLAITLAFGATPAHADDSGLPVMPDIAQAQCLGCHQVDRQRVGPAFTAVAKRYHEADQADDHLVQAILQGSRGRWGAIPMPAQSHISKQEAAAIAQWLLSLPLD